MGSHPKPLVMYRRNSSDMDMSDTDEESEGPSVSLSQHRIPPPNASEVIKSESEDKKLDKEIKPLMESLISPQEFERSKREARREETTTKSSRDQKHSRSKHDDTRSSRDSDSKHSRHEDSSRSSRDSRHSERHDRRRSSERRRHSRSRSPDKRKSSPDRKRHERKRSRSPRRSPDASYFKSRRLERKAARIDALGIELVAEENPELQGVAQNGVPRVVDAKQLPNLIGASGQQRLAEQMQKRKLLWGNKEKKEGIATATSTSSWNAATFKGDSDGKMTEKFKRLMGIKEDGAQNVAGTSKNPPKEGAALIKRQEELFSNMEAQYQVARLATHTHRGIGLGFGTFQVTPR